MLKCQKAKQDFFVMFSHLVEIIVLLAFFFSRLGLSADQKSRFKSLKCFTDDSSEITIHYCGVKVTRTSSALSINLTFHRNFSKHVTMKTALFYKYGNIYRQVVKVPDYELCYTMKRLDILPMFMQAMFDVMGESGKTVRKGCPFYGRNDYFFLFDDSKWPSIFPSGMYKIEASACASTLSFHTVIGLIFQLEIVSVILKMNLNPKI